MAPSAGDDEAAVAARRPTASAKEGPPARRTIAGSRRLSRLAVALGLVSTAAYIFGQVGLPLTVSKWSRWGGGTGSAGGQGLDRGAEVVAEGREGGSGSDNGVDIGWYPPKATALNDLGAVVAGEGVYGFIYNSSETPGGQYGTFNWCNMPHVRKQEYVVPPGEFELHFVEVIHRHHKRTPYASNRFPRESLVWDCSTQRLYTYEAMGADTDRPARTYLSRHNSLTNPFDDAGAAAENGSSTCRFPQVTAGGLADARLHGADLYEVYHGLLGLLPGRPRRRRRGDASESGLRSGSESGPDSDSDWRAMVAYRVTNNVITSEVAGMVVGGMWGGGEEVELEVEPNGIDSLEPQYSCPAGSKLFDAIRSGRNLPWAAHLTAASPLFAALDAVTGVPASDEGFHASLDHYYDNMSSRECHARPLPCSDPRHDAEEGHDGGASDESSRRRCVTRELADAAYRFGHWEYSRAYRDDERSLAASAATLGVWIAELAEHLRSAAAARRAAGRHGRESRVVYVHNVAHDGSLARLLSVLQVEVMVWPGMGAEVVFELWKRKSKAQGEAGNGSDGGGDLSGYYVRVLFGGRVLRSSSPTLGVMDMVPVEKVLAYFDGLVGRRAGLVLKKCNDGMRFNS